LTLGALGITATSGTAATIGGFAVSGIVAGRAGRITANLLTGQSLTTGVFDPGSLLFDAGWGALTGGLLKSPDILLDLRAGSDAFHPDVVDPLVSNWGQGVDRLFGLTGSIKPIEDGTGVKFSGRQVTRPEFDTYEARVAYYEARQTHSNTLTISLTNILVG
jgi:hypothetical protein